MKVVDLFSGCGGMSLGFEDAGFEIVGAFDNWDAAIKIYKANFSHPIYKMDLNEELRNALIHRLNQRYENVCLWNIVEEMEQNLYPSSQMAVLLSLLAIFNQVDGNELILTTHSPYILDYVTLAAKAGMMKESFGNDEAKLSRLNNIIPLESVIYPGTYIIYQITDNGMVEPLALPSGLPEDNNYLNALLEETNSTFNDLLDLEDE